MYDGKSKRWMRNCATVSVCGLGFLAGGLCAPASLRADEGKTAATAVKPVVVGQPTGIDVLPVKTELKGQRSRQQLIVTGKYSSQEERDITSAAAFVVADPKIAKVEQGVVYPLADGATQITAEVAGQKTTVEVAVSGMQVSSPVSFRNETLAALTKAGCNMGACHGSPSGKAGFRLSLRGFDPPLDIMTLRTEYLGRRTYPLDPEESLILKKPLMEVAHGGGRRLHKNDACYVILRNWIAEGLKVDAPDAPQLAKVEVFPPKRVGKHDATQQQLFVMGTYSDGTVRDVTELAVFSSSNESVATVDEHGLVAKTGRGETAVLARVLEKMATSYVTFLEDVPGFAWNDPKPNNFIDTIAFDKLKQLQILPSELCTDEEFVRRACLDVTGRLPKVDESLAFLNDAAPDKRERLIDELLDSPDYAAFWTLKWGDILRSNSKKLSAPGVQKFRQWIFDQVRNDTPLDRFARELLTATGSVYQNPAANYWRASRDPNDATETTAQLFLGIRIQCAKCHNHPFERWSQDNYYGIAAAFTRIGRKPGTNSTDDEVIFTQPSGEIQQPRSGQMMKVHLLLKGDVDVPAEQDRRAVFAQWLTGADNPFFAKAAVNRIWGHLMGRGIVEPVDDFRDSNPPSNAALLDELTRQFVENGYSTKWAIRTIMRSRLYQLSSRKNDFNKDDEIYASHATTRLLSAEQLLDAICHVTGVPETFEGVPVGTRAVELADPPTEHYFLKIFGQPQREMACQCERSSESNLSQALQMINGPVVHNKLRDKACRITQMMEQSKSDAEIIETLYLAALSRKPAPEEMDAATKYISAAADRKQGLEDVGWAVVNSKEFLFQH